MPMPEDFNSPTPVPAEQFPDAVRDEILPTAELELACKMSQTSDCLGEPIVGTCLICREPFCEKHRSDADSDSCMMCTDFQTIETSRDPLVSEDGVTHAGAVIHPIGYSYRTLMHRIVEMDDVQLEAHIVHVKKQVKEAETVLDYRRIDLSSSQVELEERGVAKAKKLRLRGVEVLAGGANKVTMPSAVSQKKNEKTLDNVAAQLKKTAAMLGIVLDTPQKLAEFALRVKAMNGGPK